MNSAKTPKKKISEYQIEDIKELFVEFLKKISSKIILLEIPKLCPASMMPGLIV